MCLILMMSSPRDDLELRGEICAQRTCFEEQERVLMALRVSGLSLWVKLQAGGEREKGNEAGTDCREGAGSYLSWQGVLTEQSFIVDGEDRGIIIYVRHRDERDAFSNLGRVLWRREREREREKREREREREPPVSCQSIQKTFL